MRTGTGRIVVGIWLGMALAPLAPAWAGGEASPTPARVPTLERDVEPLLTRLGCNAGACHGKQRGQNGFQLSLLGFDPSFDLDAMVREAKGRRIFPAAPEQSLLLLKGTARVPHGGGKKLDPESPYYRTLRDWIAAGCPRDAADAPRPVKLEVDPAETTVATGAVVPLRITARFSDGTSEDVTALSAFQSNESAIAAVGADGVVKVGTIPGEAAITARYRDQFATCLVTIPLAGEVDPGVYDRLPRSNYIDDLVWAKLKKLGITPSDPAPAATLLRRTYLDVIGRLPTPEEVRGHLADPTPEAERQAKLVDRLLKRPEYADHWATKWMDLLRPNPYRVGIKAVFNLDGWIREAFRRNEPYGRFVRQVVAARGSTFRPSPATIFRDRREPEELTTVVSQLFLGIRLECAKCHHHPFEVWGQDDFYSFAAYFAGVGRKGTGLSPPISGSEEMVFAGPAGQVKHPQTGAPVPARPLFEAGGKDGKDDKTAAVAKSAATPPADPREALADWITAPTNPFFGRVIVNRVWADLMGRGLVEPVDDLRATNPPTNGPLLDALADDFRRGGCDLKRLIRTIATSHAYALSSLPGDRNAADTRNFSRHYRQRLRAEVLLDAVSDVTGVPARFDAAPAGTRASGLWTVRTESLFLDTFGRPDPNQDPPCERVSDTSVTQALHLMNAPDLHERLRSDKGLAARLASSGRDAGSIAEELYLRCYSRPPEADERRTVAEVLAGADGPAARRAAVEDLLWALINTPEFVFKD